MPPKTPIWKSIGRKTNRTNLLPWRWKTCKKKDKIGGDENPRVSRGLGVKEKREGMGIYCGKGRRSEIFQTPFLRRQDLDWQQPLSKRAASRGSHHRPVVCLSFPFFLPLLLPTYLHTSPLLLSLPSPSLRYSYIPPIIYCASLSPIHLFFSLSLFLPSLNFVDTATNTARAGIQDLSEFLSPSHIPHPFPPWPFHTNPLRLTRALSAPLVFLL
jgi:hypothetical protein